MSILGITLSLQGDANCEGCERKKGSSKKSCFHFVLRSLTRGSLKVVLCAVKIARVADFAGLLAWRQYQLTAFPRRRPSFSSVTAKRSTSNATLTGPRTTNSSLQWSVGYSSALQSRGGDGFFHGDPDQAGIT